MSVAEFSNTIKSYAFRKFFNALSRTSVLKTSVSDLRDAEQTAEKTSFYLSPDVISQVVEKISGTAATPEQVDKIINKLKQVRYGVGQKRKAIVQGQPNLKDGSLYFPKISFDTINRVLEEGFSDILTEARKTKGDIRISDYFDRGHVFGILTNKVGELLGSVRSSTSLADEPGKQLLINVLEDFYKYLQDEDIATSNLKSLNYKLYAKYIKNKNRYLVELQLADVNQQAGRDVAQLSSALRKYLSPDKTTTKFTAGTSAQLLKSLIENRGSPSMLDLIQESIIDALKGGKTGSKEYAINFTEVDSINYTIDNTEVKNLIKKQKEQVRKAINAAKKQISDTRSKKLAQATAPLVPLLVILNQLLPLQIRRNMGSGDSKTVLNYRTGRFASSVKVDKLTIGREGMITAYYNYMKYPYATFSEGGEQQYPPSRDPKLLISKSIREIAATQVSNRMRAVLV